MFGLSILALITLVSCGTKNGKYVECESIVVYSGGTKTLSKNTTTIDYTNYNLEVKKSEITIYFNKQNRMVKQITENYDANDELINKTTAYYYLSNADVIEIIYK